MTINDIYLYIIQYINKNKINYNIEYKETIETIKQLIKEIEEDYYKIQGSEK